MAEVAAILGGGRRLVEVTLVGERRMARMNRRYRGRRGAAEILTFDYGAAAGGCADDPRGEILICGKRLVAGARRAGVSRRAYLLRLLAHGLCHLKGHSHRGEAAGARMEAVERRCLEGLLSAREIGRLFPRDKRRE